MTHALSQALLQKAAAEAATMVTTRPAAFSNSLLLQLTYIIFGCI